MPATSYRRPLKQERTRTLCIVDMQEDFMDAGKYCLPHVLHEIELAKTRQAGIVVLEFEDCGRTVKEIRRALSGYKHQTTVRKNNDDGSAEFLKGATKNRFNTYMVRVCGVNRSYCVLETVLGIKDEKEGAVDIEVAINATWCTVPANGRERLLGAVGRKKFVRNGNHIKPPHRTSPRKMGYDW